MKPKIKKNLIRLLIAGFIVFLGFTLRNYVIAQKQLKEAQQTAEFNPYENFANSMQHKNSSEVITPILKFVSQLDLSNPAAVEHKWLLMTDKNESIVLYVPIEKCGPLSMNKYDMVVVAGALSFENNEARIDLRSLKNQKKTSLSEAWIEVQGRKICRISL